MGPLWEEVLWDLSSIAKLAVHVYKGRTFDGYAMRPRI